MKGQTNAWLKDIVSGEKISITLTTNQSSHTDLIGAVITVSYAGNLTEYTWEGSAIQTVIPHMTDYTVSYSDVNGYSTPEQFSGKAIDGRVSEVIGTYNTEIVTVNVSAEEGEVSGYEIQIISDGNVLYTQTTSSATYKFPYGTSYTIKAGDVSGYTTPSEQSFTASQSARNLEVVYSNDDYGVYIQSIEGGLYTVDRWDGAKTPNGIAVITDKTRFVISKDGNTALAITTDDFAGAKYDQYMTSFTTSTDAKKDYNGEANTNNMIKVLSDTDKAAGFCKNFTFPNGKKGFLPSLGQMNAAYNNKDAVDAALAKIGGEAFVINGTAYKTSTLGIVYSDGSGGFWIFRWNDGHSESYSPLNGHAVRVFTSI